MFVCFCFSKLCNCVTFEARMMIICSVNLSKSNTFTIHIDQPISTGMSWLGVDIHISICMWVI